MAQRPRWLRQAAAESREDELVGLPPAAVSRRIRGDRGAGRPRRCPVSIFWIPESGGGRLAEEAVEANRRRCQREDARHAPVAANDEICPGQEHGVMTGRELFLRQAVLGPPKKYPGDREDGEERGRGREGDPDNRQCRNFLRLRM
jgi:hypothetical protein